MCLVWRWCMLKTTDSNYQQGASIVDFFRKQQIELITSVEDTSK